MPIPTRSQSVRTREQSGIPTRQVSARQRAQDVTTKPAINSDLAVSKVRSANYGQTETQTKGPSVRDARSQSKSVISHARNASTVSAHITATGAPTTKGINHSTIESKASNTVNPPKSVSHITTSTRNHARTASTTTPAASKTSFAGSRLAVAKADGNIQGKNVTLQKRTADPSAQGSVNPTSAESSAAGFRHELLQLQLVYARSSHNLKAHRHQIANIKNRETKQILDDQQEILDLESSANKASNSRALRQWLDKAQDGNDEQKIQNLSSILAEVENYNHNPNILAPLLQFELWLSETLLVIERRASVADSELRFADTLGSTWRAQMLDLRQRISNTLSMLSGIGDIDTESGLAIAVERSIALLKTLFSEVETALSIERSIHQTESRWKKQELEKALNDLPKGENSDQRVGVWVD